MRIGFLTVPPYVPQIVEKRGDGADSDPPPEGLGDATDSPTGQARAGGEAAGLVEQPFIKLSQEEYGEHHSSIMHCRWAPLPLLSVSGGTLVCSGVSPTLRLRF